MCCKEKLVNFKTDETAAAVCILSADGGESVGGLRRFTAEQHQWTSML